MLCVHDWTTYVYIALGCFWIFIFPMARHPLSSFLPVQTKKNIRWCTCSPEARCWTKNWETKTSNLKKQPRRNKHLFGLPSGSAHIDGVSAFFIHKTLVIEMVIVVFQKWRKRLMYNVKNMLDPQQTARFEENNSLYFDKFIGKHFWIHQGNYEIRDHPLTPTPNQHVEKESCCCTLTLNWPKRMRTSSKWRAASAMNHKLLIRILKNDAKHCNTPSLQDVFFQIIALHHGPDVKGWTHSERDNHLYCPKMFHLFVCNYCMDQNRTDMCSNK